MDPPDSMDLFFKPGQPAQGERLNESVISGAPKFDQLDSYLVLVLHMKPYKIAITGYTDQLECRAPKCMELSQRRAKLVYALLIQKGFPADRIVEPVGYGNSRPRYLKDQEKHRAYERRASISMVDADGG